MPGISAKLPLRENSVDGRYEQNKTLKEVASQDLKSLVLTIPGERILLPNYGIGLQQYLFEPVDDIERMKADISSRSQEQVSLWMPYIQINFIQFNFDEQFNEHLLGASYYYTIKPLSINDILSVTNEQGTV